MRPAATRGLLLHCGAETVPRGEVFATPTPAPTHSWFPLAHRDLISEVEGQLEGAGFTVGAETHSLSHGGDRYFGIFEVAQPGRPPGDHAWVVGLRNSHDKSFPAGLVAGSRVLVCDNIAFTGEVRISRKHTRFAARDLRHLTARAVGQLGDRLLQLDARIAAYRGRGITDPKAHDIVVRAVDCLAITATQVPKVLEGWRRPPHPEFIPRTAWSLFNAVTAAQKGLNPAALIARTQALHGLFDGLVGYN